MIESKLLICIAFSLAFPYLAECKPWEPVPRLEQWWVDRHNAFVDNTIFNGSNINIVFMGSSSVEFWSTTGGSIWREKYEPLGAVNYGIGGDSIEHCLWRSLNGELYNINPKILMLYCGSNNIPGDHTAPEIIRGITETLEYLAARLPQTKILYVSINPRGDSGDTTIIEAMWGKITVINSQIELLHDGNQMNIFTMFDDFITSWGQVNVDLFENDKLHLNRDGYVLWDNLWNETFFNLWNSFK